MDEGQAVAQRHAEMVHELQRRGAGAALLAVDHDEVGQDACFLHGFDHAKPFPRMTHAKFESHGLVEAEFAQALHEFKQFNRRGKTAVRCWRNAIGSQWHAPSFGDFWRDFGGRQHTAMPRFGALAEFDFDHSHLRFTRLGHKTFRVKMPLIVSTTKVT